MRVAGTFTTSMFEDRAALHADRPSRVAVSHNQFVTIGLELFWRILLGQQRNEQGGLSDHLGKARLIVGNGATPFSDSDERLAGDQTAWADLDDGYPRTDGPVDTDEGRVFRVTFQATFGEQVANFDWRERGITSVQGVLVDRSVGDQGRKAPGSVWTMQAALDLAG